MLSDPRHAVRLLRRAPSFTAASILTLALGLGTTTAIFAVAYGVLLRPLPISRADRPAPRRYDARQPGLYVQRRAAWIQRQMRQIGGEAYLRRLE